MNFEISLSYIPSIISVDHNASHQIKTKTDITDIEIIEKVSKGEFQETSGIIPIDSPTIPKN